MDLYVNEHAEWLRKQIHSIFSIFLYFFAQL